MAPQAHLLKMTFTPFDKAFHDLDLPALSTLVANKVAEGYWVEYKTTFPTNIKIAHSVASFANTAGGWYFVGVKSDPKTNEAIAIPGFSTVDYPDPVSKMREVVKSSIDPIPLFHTKLIPIDALSAILAVFIPDHQQTPFITRDGRIYRRNADSSDPVRETDRHSLDRLIDQGRVPAAQFENFCVDPRGFTQTEIRAWAKIYIDPHSVQPTEPFPDRFSSNELEGLRRRASSVVEAKLPDSSPYMSGSISFNVALFTNRIYSAIWLVRNCGENGVPIMA